MHIGQQAANDIVMQLIEQVSFAARWELQLRNAGVVRVHYLRTDCGKRWRRSVARPAS